MMEKARRMLIEQGHSGERSPSPSALASASASASPSSSHPHPHPGERSAIMMVGDRFDTDVRAGISADFKTCLVLSGCHSLEYQHDP